LAEKPRSLSFFSISTTSSRDVVESRYFLADRSQQRRHWRAPNAFGPPHAGQRKARGFFLILSTDRSGLNSKRNSRTSFSSARSGHLRRRRSQGQKNGTFPAFVTVVN
jgi:hypothetical protein